MDLTSKNLYMKDATFTRPANTTAYTAGDLVANSVTANLVAAMSWAIPANVAFDAVGIMLQKSTATRTAASFRLHLLSTLPTFVTAGDNDPTATVVATGIAGLLQSFDGQCLSGFADGAAGLLVPTASLVIPTFKKVVAATPLVVYGILEALDAYAPGNAEIFVATLILETKR